MSERMKWSEAEAVVRAYRAEHGAGDVDVATLARALGTDVTEVRRLAGRKRRFIDRSGVLSAALALGVVALVAPLLLARHSLVASRADRVPIAPMAVLTGRKMMIVADGQGRVHVLETDGGTHLDPTQRTLWAYPGPGEREFAPEVDKTL